MITIEPIMDIDMDVFVKWIKDIKPEFVNIGADSKGHKLPEPDAFKIGKLITELEKFTKVNLKENLKRIYPLEMKVLRRDWNTRNKIVRDPHFLIEDDIVANNDLEKLKSNEGINISQVFDEELDKLTDKNLSKISKKQ